MLDIITWFFFFFLDCCSIQQSGPCLPPHYYLLQSMFQMARNLWGNHTLSLSPYACVYKVPNLRTSGSPFFTWVAALHPLGLRLSAFSDLQVKVRDLFSLGCLSHVAVPLPCWNSLSVCGAASTHLCILSIHPRATEWVLGKHWWSSWMNSGCMTTLEEKEANWFLRKSSGSQTGAVSLFEF